MAEVFGDGDEGNDCEAGEGSDDDGEDVEDTVFGEVKAAEAGEEDGAPGGGVCGRSDPGGKGSGVCGHSSIVTLFAGRAKD